LAAIAAADGTVSRETVRTAIDETTCKNLQVEPTKTIGKDGKARPTKYVKTPKKRTAQNCSVQHIDFIQKFNAVKTNQIN
jgi:hypothetical protein